MKIAGLVQDSIVDGPGLRFAVFAQGCKFSCEGCHNPTARDIGGGREMTVDEIIREMEKNPLTDGLTLTGGEPFLQAEECALLAQAAREKGLDVWVYSGYTFEELFARAGAEPGIAAMLGAADVLVDGQFVLSERSLSAKWRGSTNQRLIDVPRSLAAGAAVEASEDKEGDLYD